MRPQVGAQVEVEAEALAADVALVGFLAGVDELVPLELAVVQKFLAAAFLSALVQSFAVSHQMFAVCDEVRKHLETVLNLADVLLCSFLEVVAVAFLFERVRTCRQHIPNCVRTNALEGIIDLLGHLRLQHDVVIVLQISWFVLRLLKFQINAT